MAEIVFGVGSSHTPQLSSSATIWADHAARDARNPALLGPDGEYHTYEELAAAAGGRYAGDLSMATWEKRFARGQECVELLAAAIAEAQPDVVVAIGDDQRELFGTDGTPAIGLFLGEQLLDLPPSPEYLARVPTDIQAAGWAAHAGHPDPYRVHTALSAHLAGQLTEAGFDLSVLSAQPEGRSLGRAFTFLRRRLGLGVEVPIVPILLNTYFPPNVPSARRCFRLGQSIRAAVEAFPGAERVAVFASGGLSHFVVLEDFDRRVLGALEDHDGEALSSLPGSFLRSGTSEVLNWVAAAGSLGHLRFELVDYIPAYRSPAGTGVGMAFALWRGPAGSNQEASRS